MIKNKYIKILVSFYFITILSPVFAQDSSLFIEQVCMQGFNTTSMPKKEANKFCACVKEDIKPQITSNQNKVISEIQDDIKRGRNPNVERFSSSGIKDLVIASQARCESSFYPPQNPIHLSSGNFRMTLRCDYETKKEEVILYNDKMKLVSKKENEIFLKRIGEDDFVPPYANVSLSIDSDKTILENWEIDITGKIVSPPEPRGFIKNIRMGKKVTLLVKKGGNEYTALFDLEGKIPLRWNACGNR